MRISKNVDALFKFGNPERTLTSSGPKKRKPEE